MLRQFREMADGTLPDSPVVQGRIRTVWLDWAVEQEDHPANYASMEGPSLVAVLDAVQKQVIDAVGPNKKETERAKRAFSAYRQAAARMPDYASRFAEVIAQSSKPGSPFTAGDANVLLKSLSSGILVAAGHPAGVVGLTPDDKLAASAQAAGHLSEAAVRAVTGKKTGDISQEEYDLFVDPRIPAHAKGDPRAQPAPGRDSVIAWSSGRRSQSPNQAGPHRHEDHRRCPGGQRKPVTSGIRSPGQAIVAGPRKCRSPGDAGLNVTT